jgi:hypothetical protein
MSPHSKAQRQSALRWLAFHGTLVGFTSLQVAHSRPGALATIRARLWLLEFVILTALNSSQRRTKQRPTWSHEPMKVDIVIKPDGRNPRPERSPTFEVRTLSIPGSKCGNLDNFGRVLKPREKGFPLRKQLPNEANRTSQSRHGVPASAVRGLERTSDANHFNTFAARTPLPLKQGLQASFLAKRTHSRKRRIENLNQRSPKIDTLKPVKLFIISDLQLFYQTKPCAHRARSRSRVQSSKFPKITKRSHAGIVK